ncbi:hypothetical protein SAMN05428949_5479 [Chitinophaga sp. YR627]|uniref:hypothetical protein n=1 Tax=Chitinophaga sp. YR627 TaxID=1881041 RepID=UPI0008EA43DD|nr:hypothetical protein [Chitinophaga sp. YR627]SFO50732.1 hypothetical protein SAMN05428949_5479 [Chitinophaga sp. YR627]
MDMYIRSSRRSYDPFLMAGGIIILGGIVAFCMKGYAWLYELIPIAIIVFIATSNTFTMSVRLTDERITVEYYQYLRKRRISVETRSAKLLLERQIAMTGRNQQIPLINYLIRISENGQEKYVINSQEGFEEKHLFELVNMFSQHAPVNRI